MALIYRPPTRQPQTAVQIDRGNPLTRGLVRAVLFNLGATPFDLVKREFLTPVGSALTTSFLPRGRGLKITDDTTTYWQMDVRSETVSSFSIGWLGQFDGGAAPMAIRDGSSVQGTFVSYLNGGQWYGRIGNGAIGPFGSASLGQTYCTLTGGGAATGLGTGFLFIADGVVFQDDNSLGIDAFISPWNVMHNGGNPNGAQGTGLLLCIWDRRLTATEGVAWTLSPYQVFAPIARRWFVPSASVGPVLSAAGVVSITATTATPQVTLTF